MPFSCAAARPLRDLRARTRSPCGSGSAPAVERAAQRLAFEQLRHDVGRRRRACRRRRSRGCSGGSSAPRRPSPRARSGAGGPGRRRTDAGRTLIATSRFEPRVARAVDLAHSAGAERAEDLVRSEPGSRAKSSPWRRRISFPKTEERQVRRLSAALLFLLPLPSGGSAGSGRATGSGRPRRGARRLREEPRRDPAARQGRVPRDATGSRRSSRGRARTGSRSDTPPMKRRRARTGPTRSTRATSISSR